jgi:hypothetical protein
VAGFLAGALAAACAETATPPALDDFKIPFWYKDFTLRSGFGYKDNVLLSSVNPEGSAFWTAGADVLVYRLPTQSWEFSAFCSFDNVGYFNKSTGVQDEQTAAAMGQVRKVLGNGWKTGIGASYLFQHQVFDVSATQTTQYTNTEVLGHNLTGRSFVRKDFKPYWVEAELSLTRQWLAEPLDGFLQAGPRVTLGRTYGHDSDLSLSYQWFYVAFDSRGQVTTTGIAEPDTLLRFQVQTVELTWRHVWDGKRRWQTLTKLGLDVNQDNGSGYFDYRQYRFAQQVKYKAGTWELSAQARAGYFDFLSQPLSTTDLEVRKKTLLTASLRADKRLGKGWRIFASYAYDRSLSNLNSDQYLANTISAGLELRF